MKKIGLVGGLGPASTVDYYMDIIKRYRAKFGEEEYPRIVIDSVNMSDVVANIANNDGQGIADIIVKSVSNLKAAGADFAVITSNSPHIAWNYMKDAFEIPVLSIIDTALQEIKKKGYKKVVVLGILYTMQNGLYDKPLAENGIIPILPSEEDKEIIGNCIYPNLENGIVIEKDRQTLIDVAEKYIKKEQADALLLGCTEIPLAIKEGDVSVPILNTTQIHIDAIMNQMC